VWFRGGDYIPPSLWGTKYVRFRGDIYIPPSFWGRTKLEVPGRATRGPLSASGRRCSLLGALLSYNDGRSKESAPMPISVECPSCRSTFRVKDEFAGKRGRCPSCKAMLTVPAASPSQRTAEQKLVPLPTDLGRQAAAALAPRAPAPKEQADYQEDATGGYALAGEVAKQAKRVRVREGALPGVGVSAEGVRQAAAPTGKMRTPAEILAAFRGGRWETKPNA
jgi:predicted Zn finger-like uncharacterized protein